MTLKEAILGRAVLGGEDVSYVRGIAEMPVIRRIGIKFIDQLTNDFNKKQMTVAINGVLGEMKEMNHGEDYLNDVRKNFALAMVNKKINCDDIVRVVDSVSNTGMKCDLALDLSRYFKKNGSEEAKDLLRSFFDKSGGSRGLN